MLTVVSDDSAVSTGRISPSAEPDETLLLIEDSEEAMCLVRFALGEYGNARYRLEWAKDLREGLLYLSKHTVALVLLDLGLPDSSGPSSFFAIRKIAQETPILVLTGDDRSETEDEVIASGTQDYLVKDQITGSLLVQAINSALYQARSHRQ